jgi:intein/homing endonuclease
MVIPREPADSAGHRRDYTPTPQRVTKAYLLGVLHDSTRRKTTFRIATKSYEFAVLLRKGILILGNKAWIYKEGKFRSVWIVEFSKNLFNEFMLKTQKDKIDYLRGYFDAEGGISKTNTVRYYLYFCQKDYEDLLKAKGYLSEFGIQSGVMHNPSRRIDQNYWRFYIRAQSYELFAQKIGSNHPDKFKYLRMKR